MRVSGFGSKKWYVGFPRSQHGSPYHAIKDTTCRICSNQALPAPPQRWGSRGAARRAADCACILGWVVKKVTGGGVGGCNSGGCRGERTRLPHMPPHALCLHVWAELPERVNE